LNGAPAGDNDKVAVAESDSLDVVFRASAGTGFVERTYRFYGNRYDFSCTLRASEALIPGAEQVAWSFGPGLTNTEMNVKDDQSRFRSSVLLGEEFHRKTPRDFGGSNQESFSGTLNWGEVIGTAAICVAQIGMFGVIRVNAELRAAQAELAVTAERERMARDLHDVLGHSLTTITVKAGLARRLLEAGEQGRAADEVADVERLGRQALSDVRATVAANRVASLPRELAGAAEALRAAGIAADLPHAVDDVPAERQEVFAYVVREAVTNTIRHSGASRCTVRLTPTSVEILDDGVGSPAGTPSGNGITGLTERLAAIGGWVDAGPTPSGGYRLRAECLPARKAARA